MKGKLGGLWLPKGIIRSMGNRLHPISVLDTEFVSLLIASKSIHTDSRISNRGPLIHGPLTQISAKHCKRLRGFRDTVIQLFSLERCGGCGGYFRSSAAARVWCVYINSKRSKKTAPAVPAEETDQFFSQHPIIYRPTHPKNSTPTGGVSPLSTTPF